MSNGPYGIDGIDFGDFELKLPQTDRLDLERNIPFYLTDTAAERSTYTLDYRALDEVLDAFALPDGMNIHVAGAMHDEAVPAAQRLESGAVRHYLKLFKPATESADRDDENEAFDAITGSVTLNVEAIRQVGQLVHRLSEDPAIAQERDRRYMTGTVARVGAKLGSLAVVDVAATIPTIHNPALMLGVMPAIAVATWSVGKDTYRTVCKQRDRKHNEVTATQQHATEIIDLKAKDLARSINLVIDRSHNA